MYERIVSYRRLAAAATADRISSVRYEPKYLSVPLVAFLALAAYALPGQVKLLGQTGSPPASGSATFERSFDDHSTVTEYESLPVKKDQYRFRTAKGLFGLEDLAWGFILILFAMALSLVGGIAWPKEKAVRWPCFLLGGIAGVVHSIFFDPYPAPMAVCGYPLMTGGICVVSCVAGQMFRCAVQRFTGNNPIVHDQPNP
jgi:hypothetical protein